MRQCYCLIIFVIGLLFTHTVSAANKTAQLTVAATILPTCEAGIPNGGGNTHFGTLNFGHYGTLETEVTTTGQVNNGAIRIKCNNGTSYSILIDSGLHSPNTTMRYLSNGSFLVNYNLYIDATRNTIWDNTLGASGVSNGQETWLPIYGLIPQQSTPPAGTYTDTVNITILY